MKPRARGDDWPDRVWNPEELRRRALELLGGEALESFRRMSEADVRALAHELRVHQVELEMQNEELLAALLERDEALDKYADLYDFAPIGLVSFDMDGRILEANLTAAALLSVYRGSLVGRTLQSFLTPGSIPVFERFRRGIVATGAKRGCDVDALTADDRRVALRIDGLAFAPGSGGEGRIRAALTDVSENRQMERTLRESEQHFRSVVESAADAIVTVDAAGNVVFWNPAAETMFGYSFSEIRGASIEAIIPEGLRDLHAAGMRRVIAAGESRVVGATVERTAVRRDGAEFPVELTLAEWGTGSHHYFTGIVRDLTERARAQDERDRLQDQLRQALKMEAIGRLAGGVAHDMNNMLTPILGYAEILLADSPQGDPHRADIEEIRSAAARARDLIRQLLAFARKQTLEMRNLDLNAVISGFERMLRRTLRADVILDLRLSAHLGHVRGDMGQIEQVLLNLAINAQDAMPGGGVLMVETDETVLHVAIEGADGEIPPGRYVVMTVTDTGHGMAPEVLERLFEPFFTNKAVGRGTGLGLATVYGIVKQHGGEILVESRLDQGTAFRVYLPRAETPADDLDGANEVQPTHGTETVLVVEDQEQVLRLSAQALRRFGYVVLEASDGEQALEAAAAHAGPIHLLLADVVMPGMNGPQLAARMRAEDPGLRVLHMSGYTDDALGREGFVGPGVELIQKPFSVLELAARVREVLDA